jgi:hypothetical protein
VTAASAQSVSPLEKLPYSGGILVGRAIRAGRIQLPAPSTRPEGPTTFNCSPAPCALPNVNASMSSVLANETPIRVNPNNSQQFITGANDYACAGIQGFYATSDGGNTFTRNCLPTLSGASGDGDPGIAYDLNGTAYATGIDSTASGTVIVISTSTNNGSTWGKAVQAVPNFLGGGADKDWLEADTSPNSPFKNNLYISTTQFASNNNSTILVSHSTDGGKTWTNVTADSTQVYPIVDQFSDLAVSANGNVYVSWQRCSATGPTGDCGGTLATMYFAKSTDGGNTWSAPAQIVTANLVADGCGCAFYGSLPNTFERISNIPVIAIDRSNTSSRGTLYVTYYNWTGTQMKVYVASSTNDGASWISRPVAPNSATNDQFFPWVNVAGNGEVGVSWMDRRNDPANVNYEAFTAFSNNHGASFSKNFDLSAAPSNPFNDGFGGFFIGDYTGNDWVGINRLLVVYTDTTTGIDQDFLVGERIR